MIATLFFYLQDKKNMADESDSGATVGGAARALLARSATAFSSMGKGLLKYWFKYPIKLFRPHTVSPYTVINAMAVSQNQTLNHKFVRALYKDEGMAFFSKNMIPVLFANACVGVVLFNTYEKISDSLENDPKSFSFKSPFIAGFGAGLAQSFLSVPIDNIHKSLDVADLIQKRSDGVLKVIKLSLAAALPPTNKGLWGVRVHLTRFLFRDFSYICLRVFFFMLRYFLEFLF
jgi:hypothetical protein